MVKVILGPTGDFPQGKLKDDDEGGLMVGIAADPAKNMLFINFATKVAWVGLPPKDARAFAAAIVAAADTLDGGEGKKN